MAQRRAFRPGGPDARFLAGQQPAESPPTEALELAEVAWKHMPSDARPEFIADLSELAAKFELPAAFAEVGVQARRSLNGELQSDT